MLFITFLLALIPAIQCSLGDRDLEFRRCLNEEVSRRCNSADFKVSTTMRIMLWSCSDVAAYDCMHKITKSRMESRQRILQYYGKWPFIQLFGIQEPASVVFSIANGYAHYKHLKVVNQYPNYPFYGMLRGYVFVGVNTWVWSTVFHCRDKPLTEKLDYFSAALAILYACYLALIRTREITRPTHQRRLMIFFSLLFLMHVSYLSFYKFDYNYNMKASIIVGMLHNVLWFVWWIKVRGKRDYAWISIAAVVSLSMAMSLELLDFPPWWFIFDAHSLWHACTVPIVLMWYRFWIADAKYCAEVSLHR